MANPVIAEVTRGGRVESVHRGAYALVDADGRLLAAGGDVENPVFARSSLKLMQALPLVESGAADALSLGSPALAVAGASHRGEAGHVAAVRALLAAAGLDEGALGCGPDWPRDVPVAAEVLAREGAPGRVHNNCSGKHASFLAASRHLGLPVEGYLRPDHPLQETVRETIATLSGAPLDEDRLATDGCSAPTFALPLRALALAFARLATGKGLSAGRAGAARRLMEAAMAEPWYVAGTGGFCTRIMTLGGGRIYVKRGAEGVCVAAFPETGLALAAKGEDGSGRGVEALVAALAARALPDPAGALEALARRPVRDFNGTAVGEIRPVLAA